MNASPLFRTNGVFQRPGDGNEWTYFRQWWSMNHPQAGIAYYFDMPGYTHLPERDVLERALMLELDREADAKLLEVYLPTGIH